MSTGRWLILSIQFNIHYNNKSAKKIRGNSEKFMDQDFRPNLEHHRQTDFPMSIIIIGGGFPTCNLQRCVPTLGVSCAVLGNTPVNAAVLLLLAVHRLQEEERSRGKKNSVRLGVHRGRLHRFAILEPLDSWFRFALCLAVERRRFPFRDCDVAGMFRYSWWPELTCRGEEEEEEENKLSISCNFKPFVPFYSLGGKKNSGVIIPEINHKWCGLIPPTACAGPRSSAQAQSTEW